MQNLDSLLASYTSKPVYYAEYGNRDCLYELKVNGAIVDRIITATTIGKTATTINPRIKKSDKQTVSVRLLPKQEDHVGILLIGEIEGTLIGIDISFDLLALISKNPYAKVAIWLADLIAQNILDVEIYFDLVISGEITAYLAGAYNAASNEKDFRMRIEGRLEVFLQLYVTSKPNQSARVGSSDKDIGVKGGGGVAVRFNVEPDDDNVMAWFEAVNTAIIVEFYVKKKMPMMIIMR